jgi:hypothetical protein
MPQNSDTGRAGYENGYGAADEIGKLLGAERIGSKSNEFVLGQTKILIKTGSSAVVTRATLARIDFIIYGFKTSDGWQLYKIDPETFEKHSSQSQSGNHDESYRLVRKKQIKEYGTHYLT